MPPSPIIFASCGQVTDEEKKLGAGVCDLIKKLTPYEPYFAENQTTLEGVSENILQSINRSAGMIAIMHPRGGRYLHPYRSPANLAKMRRPGSRQSVKPIRPKCSG